MDREHLASPDPELAPFLASPLPSFFPGLDVHAARQQLANVVVPSIQKSFEGKLPPALSYKVTNYTIPVDEQNGTIEVRAIAPTAGSDGFPVLVWYHGGGWSMGGLEQDEYQLRILAVEMQLLVVNVGYRHAPEHPFPAPLEDAYAALKWVVSNASRLKGDIKKGLIVAGMASGGNLAACVVNRARSDQCLSSDSNSLIISGQILHGPALCHPAAYPEQYKSQLTSYERSESFPLFDKAGVDLCYSTYAGPPTDPSVSPLLDSPVGVMPTYLQICGMEAWCDEAILYAKLLEEAGVLVKMQMYPGAPHGFQYLFVETALAKKWEADLRDGIRWILEGQTATL